MALKLQETSLATANGSIPLFYAQPDSPGPHPVIIVLHEIFGVRGHADKVCTDLADLGYFAVAPMLVSRHGDVYAATTVADVQKIILQSYDSEIRSDIDATIGWLGQQGGADIDRLGLTGFCWGGRHAWLYCADSALPKAAVAWYGGPITAQPTPQRPRNPLDIVSQLKVPTLGLYGGSDTLISLESINRMSHALLQAGKASEIVTFAGAGHGFHSHRNGHHPEAAKEGWSLMLDWFARHGVVPCR
jgi:carboxymethylenebutenolidase